MSHCGEFFSNKSNAFPFKGSKAGDEIYLPYEDNSLFTIDL